MKIPFKIPSFLSLKGKLGRGDPDDPEEQDDLDTPDDEPEVTGADIDEDDDLDPEHDDEEGHGIRKTLVMVAGLAAILIVGGGVAWMVVGEDEKTATSLPGVPVVSLDISEAFDAGKAKQTTGKSIGGLLSVGPQAFAKMRAVTSSSALPQAPIDGLFENSAAGLLPVTAKDGRTSWQLYAARNPKPDGRPRIAVLITGLGMSNAVTRAAINNLPGEVSLAFSPYAAQLTGKVDATRRSGHEVLLQLPIETDRFPTHDPGPLAVDSSVSVDENLRRAEYVLSQAVGYVGIVGTMGARFAGAKEKSASILQMVHQRGLLYVDGHDRRQTLPLAARMASDIGLPRVLGDMVIEDGLSRAEVVAMLSEIEVIARKNAFALLISEPTPVALQSINAWVNSLALKNIALVPVTALADKQLIQ